MEPKPDQTPNRTGWRGRLLGERVVKVILQAGAVAAALGSIAALTFALVDRLGGSDATGTTQTPTRPYELKITSVEPSSYLQHARYINPNAKLPADADPNEPGLEVVYRAAVNDLERATRFVVALALEQDGESTPYGSSQPKVFKAPSDSCDSCRGWISIRGLAKPTVVRVRIELQPSGGGNPLRTAYSDPVVVPE